MNVRSFILNKYPITGMAWAGIRRQVQIILTFFATSHC